MPAPIQPTGEEELAGKSSSYTPREIKDIVNSESIAILKRLEDKKITTLRGLLVIDVIPLSAIQAERSRYGVEK